MGTPQCKHHTGEKDLSVFAAVLDAKSIILCAIAHVNFVWTLSKKKDSFMLVCMCWRARVCVYYVLFGRVKPELKAEKTSNKHAHAQNDYLNSEMTGPTPVPTEPTEKVLC